VKPNTIKNGAAIKPPPVGSPFIPNVLSTNSSTNTLGWDQLLPTFGPVSRARSKWIALGEAGTRPDSALSDPVEFFFGGTNPADGFVLKTGTQVQELPPVLGTALNSGSVLAIENNFRTAVVSDDNLTDDIYRRNPTLLRDFLLRLMPQGGGAFEFDVAAAAYDEVTGLFRLTVSGTGSVLAGFEQADFALIPRFFAVSTDGSEDSLPDSTTVQIEFQATTATLTGEPDESATAVSAWVTDITMLNGNPDWRFVRFRVRFDIDAQMTGVLNADTPRPALEFLRVPFRF
jgi:hypothetical protein